MSKLSKVSESRLLPRSFGSEELGSAMSLVGLIGRTHLWETNVDVWWLEQHGMLYDHFWRRLEQANVFNTKTGSVEPDA